MCDMAKHCFSKIDSMHFCSLVRCREDCKAAEDATVDRAAVDDTDGVM